MRDIHKRLKKLHHLGKLEPQRPGLAFLTLPRENLRGLLLDLRDKEGFTHLVLLTAVDWMEEGLFQLTYMMNNRAADMTLGIRVMLDREAATGDSIHDLWPTAATYQRELKEMFGIDFPGSPRVDDEFILEGWTDLPPYRRDFDSLAYSQQTYAERPGRVTHDPREYMKSKLYPDGV
ncbi:NADH-quinone oxidoreductase subunit C [Tropicimonas sp. IMCC6043]|uniref:NADH-quinone oxidoreductase subunit C n=1 Tax=Tropicimonas sp. IMCC6043 TaxID=2510645 RepID=UPI00101BA7DD|nr:NADH-quinone oxidoreductase subunit C [Tropicimonas sp. IMCC6043]RYH09509.1 NADH-quinone oxidoreductase subunit C [Tropicimonas sp. IMCC6043]